MLDAGATLPSSLASIFRLGHSFWVTWSVAKPKINDRKGLGESLRVGSYLLWMTVLIIRVVWNSKPLPLLLSLCSATLGAAVGEIIFKQHYSAYFS